MLWSMTSFAYSCVALIAWGVRFAGSNAQHFTTVTNLAFVLIIACVPLVTYTRSVHGLLLGCVMSVAIFAGCSSFAFLVGYHTVHNFTGTLRVAWDRWEWTSWAFVWLLQLVLLASAFVRYEQYEAVVFVLQCAVLVVATTSLYTKRTTLRAYVVMRL